MARKSTPKPARRTAPISNQALIEQCITTLNMTGENCISEIMGVLLRQRDNLDAIIDDGERAVVAEQYDWPLPSTADQVEYVQGQIKKSTAAKGRSQWQSLLIGNKISDLSAYHKLRNQRLREQIRQTKKKVDDAWDAAEKRAEITRSTGGAEAVSWEDAEDVVVTRIPTFHPKLDEWFGTTIDYEIPKGKRKPVEVRTSGVAQGFSHALGAPKGMGKTRLMVKFLGEMCGPRKTREDGVEYGGYTGLYAQAEESMGMFRSVFLRNVWKPGEVAVDFTEASLLDDLAYLIERDRPDFVVIDSKDMIHEFTGPDQRVRDGMLRFNELLARTGSTAFIISHVSKSSGDIKGSSMFGHMARAVILGEVDEYNEGRFSLKFDKNRAGETRKPIRWRHGPHTVELDEGKVIKSPDKPDLTRLSARSGGNTGSTADSILTAIEMASGRAAVRREDPEEVESEESDS